MKDEQKLVTWTHYMILIYKLVICKEGFLSDIDLGKVEL